MKTLRFLLILLATVLLVSCNVRLKLDRTSEKTTSISSSINKDSALYIIATTDKDSKIRENAVSKITFGPSLTEIAKTDKDPEVRKLASERLIQLN
ncbi:hypothetical protein [Polaribacter sp. IC073]|uniref:hypothetical protein n=1 Tax=Polaribacter sp. IC073 TaxID=2508540 RepID=UPI0011BF0D8F|nr:hypothetical protein [Polaribacter sp. IC073]TXD48389.1 hypothetical protein ES045_08165 [Polaribacter sp. IC073]